VRDVVVENRPQGRRGVWATRLRGNTIIRARGANTAQVRLVCMSASPSDVVASTAVLITGV
jgi:hypothetical protein